MTPGRVIVRIAIWAGITLAGCSADPTPDPQPAPETTGTPAAIPTLAPPPRGGSANARLPAPELDGVGMARGRWRLQASAAGAGASFEDGAALRLAIRCRASERRIAFALPGTPAGLLHVVTDTGAAAYRAEADGDMVVATTSADDAFLRLLARGEGRIGVRLDAGPVMIVPPDAAIAQVLRHCTAPVAG